MLSQYLFSTFVSEPIPESFVESTPQGSFHVSPDVGPTATAADASDGSKAVRPSQKWCVLLADDHTLVREGLALLINAQPDMRVVAQAASKRDAIAQAQNVLHAPLDIVVMDIGTAQGDGLIATRHIRAMLPGIKVLALSIHDDVSYARQILEAGASGYALKQSAAADLIGGIRTVAAEATYLDPLLTAQLINRLVEGANETNDEFISGVDSAAASETIGSGSVFLQFNEVMSGGGLVGRLNR